MSLIDAITYVVLGAALLSSVGYIYVLRSNIKKLIGFHAQLMIDKQALLEKLAEALNIIEQKPIEKTDGFLQYLESTRDSAFGFIETMQASIDKFDKETEVIFTKSELTPDDVKEIRLAYIKLKAATLPNDVPNN